MEFFFELKQPFCFFGILLKNNIMEKAFSFLVIVLLTISCNNVDDVVNTSTQNPIDVYVAGQKNGQPCYWKNNQLVMLDSGGFNNAYATKIIVSNGDVHVLGETPVPQFVNSYSLYLYWKNGVLTNLHDELDTGTDVLKYISNMTVVNDDVYFSGGIANSINAFNSKPALWANGIITILENQPNGNYLTSIQVINNNVYAFGNKYINNETRFGYYLNNVFYSESDTNFYGVQYSNNHIYLFGSKINSSTNTYTGFYRDEQTGIETFITNTDSVSDIITDSGNMYFNTSNGLYLNNNLISILTNGNLLRFLTILDNNNYTLSVTDSSDLTYYFEINNIISMQINESQGRFISLFLVQN